MITYSSENVKMPKIRRRDTSAWIKKVAATYGKKVGEVAQVQVPAGLMEFEILEISL